MSALDIVQNLGSYSLQVCLVLGVGLVLPSLFKLRAPRVRLRYWYSLLALALVLPILPSWSGSSSEPLISEAEVSVLGSSELVSLGANPSSAGPALAAALLWMVGLGTAVRLVWLALGAHNLYGLRRRARPIEAPVALSGLGRVATGIDLRFFETSAIDSPVTFGWLDPTILLPAGFDRLTPLEQEAALCHELVHVDRRDWLSVLFEEVVRSVLWFHPFIWWLLARIGLSREEVVDQEVVRFTDRRKVYLETLLKIAQGSHRPRQLLGATLVHRNDLESRFRSLLQENSMSKSHQNVALFAVSFIVALSVAVAGYAFPLSPGSQGGNNFEADGSRSRSEETVRFATGGPIHVSGDVQAPRKLRSPAPQYTSEARDARIQGVVILQAVIDGGGAVTQVEVLKGLPMGLSENAAKAVKGWTFSPATLDGEPVEVYYNLTVNFRLKEKPTEDIEPPVLQYSTTPRYTDRARAAGLEGKVHLELTIDSDGVVQNARVVEGLPMGLSQSAAAAAFDWKFLPATLDGSAVQVVYPVEVEFDL